MLNENRKTSIFLLPRSSYSFITAMRIRWKKYSRTQSNPQGQVQVDDKNEKLLLAILSVNFCQLKLTFERENKTYKKLGEIALVKNNIGERR